MTAQRNVMWAYRNRMEYHDRVDAIMRREARRQMRVDLMQTIKGLLEYARYDSHHVKNVWTDGRAAIEFDLIYPGGTVQRIKMTVEVS